MSEGELPAEHSTDASADDDRDVDTHLHAGRQRESDDPRCDLCGAPMLERHCKLVCVQCGYMRDCSDP